MDGWREADVKPNAISLFSGGGIGDLGFRAAGFTLSHAVEIAADRAELLSSNFQNTEVLNRNIYDVLSDIEKGEISFPHCDLLSITPPCQGMSPNGQGKILNLERIGKRASEDVRNLLILPAISIAKLIRPKWIMMENVPRMSKQFIPIDDSRELITDIIHKELGRDYIYHFSVIDFADYGVPQNRKRLIGIFCRKDVAQQRGISVSKISPPVTHALKSKDKSKWITLRESIGHLPPLDGINAQQAQSAEHILHRVPVLDPKKYVWISNTPEGESAFNNQCIECGFLGNPRHSMRKSEEGINQASKDTPLYCIACGGLLPRPYTMEKSTGIKRIMSGYTSAYKRMRWDEPSPTLTMNLQYPSSDNKLHPEQNRVLSLLEAEIIQTIDRYDYSWSKSSNNEICPATLIADVIGESIPPLFTEIVGRHIIGLEKDVKRAFQAQANLFDSLLV